ncbi:MAG: type II toxin-antitoxin system Phd/YefM family antitoxin [Sulfuritalea sp.]|nr:type II toxin-antitoxin system Phd/YefM family antitoxin [Sulfuritalea sp.]
MGAIAFAEFKRRADDIIEQVCDTAEPVTVTRADGRNVVIVSAAEWAAIAETLHLMSSSENEARLNDAAAEIKAEIARRRAA